MLNILVMFLIDFILGKPSKLFLINIIKFFWLVKEDSNI